MDSNNLKAFVAVAESRSFSRAAEQLFLTQPAISKRIAALEQDVGNALFNRIGRSVDLTPAGLSLLTRAKHILHELELARIEIDNLAEGVKGPLRFGMSHHVGLRRMPPLLRAYSKQYPEVQLNIQFLGSEEASIAVEHGELEFALITLPDTRSPSLETVEIWRDPLAIVTASDDPISLDTVSDLQHLTEKPAILPTADTATRQLIETGFLQHHCKLRVGMETNNLETIKMMVSIGIGWSVLPLTMLDEQIRAHQIGEFDLIRMLGTVKHRKRSISNAANAMLGLLNSNRQL